MDSPYIIDRAIVLDIKIMENAKTLQFLLQEKVREGERRDKMELDNQ